MTAAVSAEQLAELARAYEGKGTEPIKRDALQNEELSFRARGVLAYLLSLPPGWETSSERIAKAGKEGRDAIRTVLAELEKAGYLIRHRHHVGGGVWKWTWIYGDSPLLVRIKFAERFPEVRAAKQARRRGVPKPSPGNPIVAVQDVAEVDVPTDGFSGGGKPGDGNPGGGKSGGGKSGGGKQGGGKSGDIESHSLENPPNPPLRGGSGSPSAGEEPTAPAKCEVHGRRNCRPCGLSPRARERAAREAAAAAETAELKRMRACWRCNSDGDVWIRGVPVSPPQQCDHSTEPELVQARVRAAEDEAEQARARRAAPDPRRPDPEVRAAAMAAARPRRRRSGSEDGELPGAVAGQV